MNKSFFPIIGAVTLLIGAPVCRAETPSPSLLCPVQPGTTCIDAIFHSNSITFVNPESRKPYPSIPALFMAGKIIVAPIYGSYLDKGQPASIDLLGQGKATILLDTSAQPYTNSTSIYVKGSGSFVLQSDPKTRIYWECQHGETFQNMPVDPKKPLNFEVKLTSIYPLDEGACVYLDPTHYSCICNYEITQK
jgi:hypothetical protein